MEKTSVGGAGWGICVLAALLASGCAGDGPPAMRTSDLDRIQSEIFNVHCLGAGCHNAQSQAGGLVLVRGASFEELVGVPPDNPAARAEGLRRVTPFAPEASFILIKLTEPGPGQGDRMPLGAPPLSPAEISLIRNWIAAGAPAPNAPAAPSNTATLTPSPTTAPTDTATDTPAPTATMTSPSPTVSPRPTGTASLPPTALPPTATASPSPTATPSPSAHATTSLAQIQETIFTPVCATIFCHSSATRSGNLVLEENWSFGELVNVLADNRAARSTGLVRVRPGDPDASFLVIKLEGPTPQQGSRMPLLLPPLKPEQIELIRRWIAEGAAPQ